MSNEKVKPETLAAHTVARLDGHTGAVAPPLYMTTTYARDEAYAPLLCENYQRNGSPTVWQAEETLAALEGGFEARLFASGMAAVVALLEALPQGAHVAAQLAMYYGTRDWLQTLERKGRIRLSLFDAAKPGAMAAAVGGACDLLWIETPSNPMWDVISIRQAADMVHAAGGVLAVDATALGGVAANPIRLGADFVFHSVTKYLNGHSDVLGGLLVAQRSSPRWDDVKALRTRMGAPLAPFESWLLMRGLRTLFVRYRQASANALSIAQHFSKHPGVERVLYPGLENHPNHSVALAEMTGGFGGMMSLLLKADFAGAQKFCTLLKVIVPATSLGGVETLAEHRKTVEGPASLVPDNLVRISVGIEHVDDLIADISQALEAI